MKEVTSTLLRSVAPRLSAVPRYSTCRLLSTKPNVSQASSTLPKPRLDYKAISENVVYKSHNAFNRNAGIPTGTVQSVEKLYEAQKTLSRELNAKRNARSAIGDKIRSSRDPSAKQHALEEAKALKSEVTELEEQLSDVDDRLLSLALSIPNDTHPSSPIGSESAAVTLSMHGPHPLPASPTRDHVSIAKSLSLIDFEAGSLVTGSSWYYLLNEAALLELALTNYAMSIALKHGFTPVTTPDVVRLDIAQRCGFNPRDSHADPPVSQMYNLASLGYDGPELVLTGTAEIPLGGMFANKLLNHRDLPIKVVGLGKAFRSEAGARGADTRGLYRVHQFTKLELFALTDEAGSEEMMEEMKRMQIEIFEGLGLSFRVLDMPTEELGASAFRKYDMEAWMPGRGSWGEISSTSNCTDYQARRLHIRYRPSPSTAGSTETVLSPPTPPLPPKSLPFVHTLNGTAAAIPRLIVALLENGARFDDSGNAIGLDLPSSLRPFWVGGGSNLPGRDVVQWV
ncbi:hypothetical protein JAAARDRAFT_188908 [Jaapia argillacea MUCL 33604]|uniref:serine--tRNA ligase n=1 Tax=Jaapia argillacea MUCL 33604 TaxID=933084 RepID=A0A067QAZ3_9AGAM|nr:hypothetical protein JAAARDRAFT_188908 [Jaapia argillacea MUCL 33604]